MFSVNCPFFFISTPIVMELIRFSHLENCGGLAVDKWSHLFTPLAYNHIVYTCTKVALFSLLFSVFVFVLCQYKVPIQKNHNKIWENIYLTNLMLI